jgi:hypothetical protein
MVTSLADSGPGSLRQAVLDANVSAGADAVAFAPGLTGTITLTSGEILITDSLAVPGPGAGVLTVSGNDQSRIFHVENFAVAVPIDVTLSGLTLTRGFSVSGLVAGGAVFADSENLTILDSVISNSTSGAQKDPSPDGCGGNVGFFGTSGGALRIADSTLSGGNSLGLNFALGGNLCVFKGKLTLERSTLSGGTATQGGGLLVDDLAEDSTISFSTISGNQGFQSGGGIFSDSLGTGILTIDSSTISGNTGGLPGPIHTGAGGGIEAHQGNLRIINSTISGNQANGEGGGIYFTGFGNTSLLLRLTTVANNTAAVKGGGILVRGAFAVVQLDHSILANGAPEDLDAEPAPHPPPPAIASNDSLIEAPGNAVVLGAHNIIGTDPLLGPLASNGGPTLTHQPLPGSPAIDAGDPAIPSPPATDQRGFARIAGAAVDLGSVEVQQQGGAEVPALSQVGVLTLSALLFAAGLRRLRQAGLPKRG